MSVKNDKRGDNKDTLFVMKSYDGFKRKEQKKREKIFTLMLKSPYVVSAFIRQDSYTLEHLEVS